MYLVLFKISNKLNFRYMYVFTYLNLFHFLLLHLFAVINLSFCKRFKYGFSNQNLLTKFVIFLIQKCLDNIALLCFYSLHVSMLTKLSDMCFRIQYS